MKCFLLLHLQLLCLCANATSSVKQYLPADTTITGSDTAAFRQDTIVPFFKNERSDKSILYGKKGIPDYHTALASVVVPAALIGYGAWSLYNPTIRSWDHSTKAEIREDHSTFRTSIDNYLEYSPALAVYALNMIGIKGKHNFKDRTILLGISTALMTSSVFVLKDKTGRLRPDGSTYNSFPSGHTATAFMGAQFMWEEYKDVSPWYGIAGYAAAAATGVLRMYNNRHWASDVIAGAGIGVLSTKAAYWLYPKIQRMFISKSANHVMVMPNYNAEWKSAGVSLIFLPK
jgi:membrane-associated phospholipid phosphatase